jgi:hypothetical protein
MFSSDRPRLAGDEKKNRRPIHSIGRVCVQRRVLRNQNAKCGNRYCGCGEMQAGKGKDRSASTLIQPELILILLIFIPSPHRSGQSGDEDDEEEDEIGVTGGGAGTAGWMEPVAGRPGLAAPAPEQPARARGWVRRPET